MGKGKMKKVEVAIKAKQLVKKISESKTISMEISSFELNFHYESNSNSFQLNTSYSGETIEERRRSNVRIEAMSRGEEDPFKNESTIPRKKSNTPEPQDIPEKHSCMCVCPKLPDDQRFVVNFYAKWNGEPDENEISMHNVRLFNLFNNNRLFKAHAGVFKCYGEANCEQIARRNIRSRIHLLSKLIEDKECISNDYKWSGWKGILVDGFDAIHSDIINFVWSRESNVTIEEFEEAIFYFVPLPMLKELEEDIVHFPDCTTSAS